jgi:hypothetical protein
VNRARGEGKDIAGQIRRLDVLSRGLHREELLILQTDGVLLYLERLAYMAATRQAASVLYLERLAYMAAKRLGIVFNSRCSARGYYLPERMPLFRHLVQG